MDFDYQQLLLTLLPDLVLVVALFAALGVDYARLQDAGLAKRHETAFRISALGLIAGLAGTAPAAMAASVQSGHSFALPTFFRIQSVSNAAAEIYPLGAGSDTDA